jgi:hemerythrin-like domain-containing protein
MKHTSLQIIRDEHASLAAMLQSMRMMVDRGPADNAENFFDVMRAMLFYIDEFPERLHHPKESNLLFPRVAKAVPHVMGTVDRLERDHMHSEKSVRDVQHLLLSWELLGDSRRQAFTDAFKQYVDAYLEHMRLEEEVILPEAEKGADRGRLERTGRRVRDQLRSADRQVPARPGLRPPVHAHRDARAGADRPGQLAACAQSASVG